MLTSEQENQMKKEAILRMRLYGVDDSTIREFKDRGSIPIYQDKRRVTTTSVTVKRLLTEMKQNDLLVYTIIISEIANDRLYSILYVNSHEDEWCLQDEDAKTGFATTFTYNETNPNLSEYGSIQIQNDCSVLIRKG